MRDLLGTLPTVSGAGTTGTAIDRGLAGITVIAVDSAGVVRGAATTGIDGAYTLSAGGTGPYRVEFAGLPTGFFPGPTGLQNGTTIRFVPDGNSPNIDLGLVRPADHSQNNPDLITNIYVFGDQINGPNRDQSVLVSFPYNSGAVDGTPGEAPYQQPTTHALAVPANQVGTTWGLAYNRFSRTVYAAAFTKKFAGYGPNGNGAIYQTATTGATASVFADLNQIFGPNTAGADFRGTPTWVAQGGFFTDGFNTGWDAVGKSSLGGMDISDDGRTLYVMNLADRNLYLLPTSGPLNATTIRRVPIPNPITLANSSNPDLDFRPFAVTYHEGKVYVGAINSAESTQDRNNLRAFVLTLDATSETFNPTPVLQFDLNYPRGLGNAFAIPPASANWLPWTPTFRNLSLQSQFEPDTIYPQPWLTGLAFDADGSLVLGIRDRTGDQVGVQTPDDPADPTTLRRGIAVGDTLRVAFDPATGAFTLENNGTVGGRTSAGAGNNQGPGGGEFYFQDFTPGPGGAVPVVHDEMSVGGVLQIPGFPDVATTTINPNREPSFFSRGGVRWFANTNGAMTRAYEAYYSGPVSTAAITFSKANGVGDLIALSDPAPLEVGNRVWLDRNRNGLQDANEPTLAGVTVRLFGQDGALIATAVTDANGNYNFSNAPGTSTSSSIYNLDRLTFNTQGLSIRLDNPADYAPGAPLNGLVATIPNVGSNSAINSSGITFSATDIRASVSVGGPGQNDHTFDFGFVAAADLGVTKVVSNATPLLGDTIAFTIVLANAGPAVATGVTLTDLLPTGLTFLAATASQGVYDAATGLWTVGTVTTITPATLVINARVDRVAALTNAASVTTSDQFDPDPANNAAAATVVAQANPSLPLVTVVSLERFGVHHQPTRLAVRFSGPLESISVQDLQNYTLTLIAHGGRFQRRVPLATVIYEPIAPTVWLRSTRPLPLRFQYRLVINATSPTGVTDTAGRLLDGDGDGIPGGDYVRVFGREALAKANRRFGPRGAGTTRELGRGYRLLARGNTLVHEAGGRGASRH